MALVNKAARERDIRQFHTGLRQELAGTVDAPAGEPLVGRQPGRLLERSREVAAGDATITCQATDRVVRFQFGFHDVAGTL